MHETFVSQLAPAKELPCADEAFLEPLRQSAEFAAIRDRVVGDSHLDSWQEDELHFFVFQLRPELDGENGADDQPEPPVTVFVMHATSTEPVSAVVVTPLLDGEQAEIRDLRDPASSYTAPLSSLND